MAALDILKDNNYPRLRTALPSHYQLKVKQNHKTTWDFRLIDRPRSKDWILFKTKKS